MRLASVRVIAIAAIATIIVAGCAVNPVTGKQQIMLVGESWDLAIGKQHYAPLRQSQGGDYTIDPGVEAYVRRVGNKLARYADKKLPYEFHVLNDSVPNAWALPGGKISINRGLLAELKDESELAAVLSHEIVHAAARHGAQGQSRGILLQGAVMGATIAGNRKGHGQAAQLASSIAAQLTNSKYGRDAELESDRFGMLYMKRAGYDLQGAIDLQKTFLRLSEGRQSDFISGLFASHPPSATRVKQNIATANELGLGGDRGKARYEKAMRRIKQTVPAYDLFKEAQVARKQKNLKRAVDLTKRAIKLEPKEAHFNSFLGDISTQVGNLKAARSYYNKALKLNPGFYYNQVRSGEIYQQSGNISAAKRNYLTSLKLLPTAEAQYGLGIIERDAGNLQDAKAYLAKAAQASGPIGDKARDALLKLDFGSNPQDYLLVNRGLTASGTFAFQLINQTSRPLTGIKLGVVINGEQTTSNISGTLGAGQSKIIDTGRRMTKQQADSIRVSVVDVRLAN